MKGRGDMRIREFVPLRVRRKRTQQSYRGSVNIALLGVCVVLVGCNDMYDKARLKQLESSSVFADGAAARPLPEGTVARTTALADDGLGTGRVNGEFTDMIPFAVSRDVLQRGRKQFTTFCTPCHGYLGDGNGMIVQRGFPRPNSFHSDSVRARPVGYYVDVITNGFGKMYSYAPSISVSDRWAIAAYIRALQLSQRSQFASLSDEEKAKVVARQSTKPSAQQRESVLSGKEH
jgi:mono/diheme cytochrome c family protein